MDKSAIDAKIMTLETLSDHIASLRRKNPNIKIGFTNGTFTVPHKGHFMLFKECAKQCDFLIVAMNSAASIAQIGRKNALQRKDDVRLRKLASQESVNAVISFDEPDAIRVMEIVKPDILFKGKEPHTEKLDFPEAVSMKNLGGITELIPTFEKPTYSATVLVQNALEKHRDHKTK